MREWLLDYLRCPQTGQPLVFADLERDGPEIVSGRLRTISGSQSYPIIDGIPRMLPGISCAADLRKVYADSFGYEWTTFDWARQRDEREFFAVTDQSPHSLADKVVLDGGCGGGRVSRIMAKHCQRLIGLDYSIAVDRARKHTADLDNCQFVQGDILHPPLARERFDFVWSHGVLHHTPDTRAGFQQLAGLVRPGGTLQIIIFLKTALPLRISDGLLRAGLRLLPYPVAARLCRCLGVLRHLPAASFWKRFVWFSLQPTPALREYCNFDWYMPRYHHEHSVDEVKSWFRAAGLADVHYINGWPDAPPEEKYAEPHGWRLVRLGQLLGVVGSKPAPVRTTPASAPTVSAMRDAAFVPSALS